MNAEEVGLAFTSKEINVADSERVVFIIPRGGLRVSPGQVYRIALRAVTTFSVGKMWRAVTAAAPPRTIINLCYAIPGAPFLLCFTN